MFTGLRKYRVCKFRHRILGRRFEEKFLFIGEYCLIVTIILKFIRWVGAGLSIQKYSIQFSYIPSLQMAHCPRYMKKLQCQCTAPVLRNKMYIFCTCIVCIPMNIFLERQDLQIFLHHIEWPPGGGRWKETP
jgi:hypothetical protein